MKRYRVKPGAKVSLRDYDPDDTGDYKDRAQAEQDLAGDLARMADLQERLYAENQRALLVVLQAMDAGGKDGTVKHVFSGVNPAGCEVTSFQAPSGEEADHDYLWRVPPHRPPRGHNRTFYSTPSQDRRAGGRRHTPAQPRPAPAPHPPHTHLPPPA